MFSPLEFPGLIIEGYTKTSDESPDYNCIAWAVHDDKRWWQPLSVYKKATYWPNAPKERTIAAYVLAFRRCGYKPVKNNNPDHDPALEKVALYAIGNTPTHAARQLPDGRWTQKMGPALDLTATLTAVEGPKYVRVVRVLAKPLPKQKPGTTS